MHSRFVKYSLTKAGLTAVRKTIKIFKKSSIINRHKKTEPQPNRGNQPSLSWNLTSYIYILTPHPQMELSER